MRCLPALAACAATSIVTFASTSAFAVGQTKASPTGKGIVGGALLGGEAVMLVESAADVKPAWAYIVGGVVGAGGGGVGGYFVEQGGDPKPSMFLLAGGMALAIPTMVAVLSATAYEPPPVSTTQDTGPSDEPVAEPAQTSSTRQRHTRTAKLPKRRTATAQRLTLYQPPALLGLEQDGYLTLSMPTIELRDMYTPVERFQFGVPQRKEIHVALLDVTF